MYVYCIITIETITFERKKFDQLGAMRRGKNVYQCRFKVERKMLVGKGWAGRSMPIRVACHCWTTGCWVYWTFLSLCLFWSFSFFHHLSFLFSFRGLRSSTALALPPLPSLFFGPFHADFIRTHAHTHYIYIYWSSCDIIVNFSKHAPFNDPHDTLECHYILFIYVYIMYNTGIHESLTLLCTQSCRRFLLLLFSSHLYTQYTLKCTGLWFVFFRACFYFLVVRFVCSSELTI